MGLKSMLVDYHQRLSASADLGGVRTKIRMGANPADVLSEFKLGGETDPAVRSFLIHRLLSLVSGYLVASINLPATVPVAWDVVSSIRDRHRFDTVVMLRRPQVGLCLINAIRQTHWQSVEPLQPFELMVVYSRRRHTGGTRDEVGFLPEFLSGFDPARTVAVESGAVDSDVHRLDSRGCGPDGDVRTTPRYVVPVTNEFFHFGNVEAWRNIIESYRRRYPGAEIAIYHRGKHIRELSTLFRWGKVCVGDTLFFSVTDNPPRDVARLKHLLALGAGPGFAPFIKKHLNCPLALF